MHPALIIMWNDYVLLTVRIFIFVSLQYLSFSATDLVYHTTWRCSSEPGLDACLYNIFKSLGIMRGFCSRKSQLIWITMPQSSLSQPGHPFIVASVPLILAFLSPHWKRGRDEREKTALGIFFNKWTPPQNEGALSLGLPISEDIDNERL